MDSDRVAAAATDLDAVLVDEKDGLAHVVGAVALEELLGEPDVEARVVALLQVVTVRPQGVHDRGVEDLPQVGKIDGA